MKGDLEFVTLRPALAGLALLLALACSSLPMPVENEWARVTEARLDKSALDGAGFSVSYSFAIRPKRDDLDHVDIIDLSGSDPVTLISGAAVGGENAWTSEKVPLSAQSVPWLFTSGPTRKLFRFVLYTQSGETLSLEQPVFFSAETKAFYRRNVQP